MGYYRYLKRVKEGKGTKVLAKTPEGTWKGYLASNIQESERRDDERRSINRKFEGGKGRGGGLGKIAPARITKKTTHDNGALFPGTNENMGRRGEESMS